MRFSRFFSISVLTLLCLSGTARAQVGEIQRLSFGEIIVTDNIGFKSVTVNTDGSFSSSPDIVFITDPQEGIYSIGGLQLSSVVQSVDITMHSPLSGPGGEIFVMDSFTYIATPTDGGGVSTITIGARARTSGNGNAYADGTFLGELELEFNF